MTDSFESTYGDWELTGNEIIFHRKPLKPIRLTYRLRVEKYPILMKSALLGISAILIYNLIGIISDPSGLMQDALPALIGLGIGALFIGLGTYYRKKKGYTSDERISYSEIDYVETRSEGQLRNMLPRLTVHYSRSDSRREINFPQWRDGGKELYEDAVDSFRSEDIEVRENDV